MKDESEKKKASFFAADSFSTTQGHGDSKKEKKLFGFLPPSKI